MANSILIVEDDEILADNVQTYLKRNNWDVQVATTAEDAIKVLEGLRPDIVLTDYLLPGKTGLELINSIMALDPQIKVIMMTGEGKVQTAVDAMKAGAYDYLTKPVVLAELKIALEKATGVSSMERALSFYQRRDAQNSGLDAIIGDSPAIAEVKRKVSQILVAERNMASGDLPAVLITGETGTGKELFARSLHVRRRAQQRTVRRSQLCVDSVQSARIRTVWTRARSLHRCQGAAHGAGRVGGRGHPVPR